MRHSLYFLFLCLIYAVGIYAGNIDERYIIRPRANDCLCFILPFEINNSNKHEKPLNADITYITSETEATLNMTIYTKRVEPLDSIVILQDDINRISLTNFQIFYIDREKQYYLHRISCRVSWEVLQNLYRNKQPYQIHIYSNGIVDEYAIPVRIWKNEQAAMISIFVVIDKNSKIL